MRDADLLEHATEHFDEERELSLAFRDLIEELEDEGKISSEQSNQLRCIRFHFDEILGLCIQGYASGLRQLEVRKIAAGKGKSRSKLRKLLEAMNAPTPSRTRNRQILEWWDQLSTLSTEHPGVIVDPLGLIPAKFTVPPGKGFYELPEVHLGFEASPLEHFKELAKVLGFKTVDALHARLERAARDAAAEGDPLGSTWIPKLDALLSAKPKREDSFPPEILALARAHQKAEVGPF